MILLDDMKVDVVNIFSNFIEEKSVALRVAECEQLEGFMGGPKKTTIQFESAEGEGVCSLWGSSRLYPMGVVLGNLGILQVHYPHQQLRGCIRQ